ncbi:MAG: hypothetical protein NVS3B21_23950 [Acidimicrobiales bacterium]
MLCFADATGEALAGVVRPGKAGANTVGDHLEVLDAAAAQLSAEIAAGHRPGDDPDLVGRAVMVRADSAGCTHGFVHGARARNIGFGVVARSNTQIHNAIVHVAFDDDRWTTAVAQDGTERDGSAVAEITDLVELSDWPDAPKPNHPTAGFRCASLNRLSNPARSPRQRQMASQAS